MRHTAAAGGCRLHRTECAHAEGGDVGGENLRGSRGAPRARTSDGGATLHGPQGLEEARQLEALLKYRLHRIATEDELVEEPEQVAELRVARVG